MNRIPAGAVCATFAAAALLGACSTTPFGEPAGAPTTTTGRPPQTVLKGYLPSDAIAQLADAVPPPYADGSLQQAEDRALSDRYRALESSDRWLLATAHAELSPELARQHFDCTLGVRFAATSCYGGNRCSKSRSTYSISKIQTFSRFPRRCPGPICHP